MDDNWLSETIPDDESKNTVIHTLYKIGDRSIIINYKGIPY